MPGASGSFIPTNNITDLNAASIIDPITNAAQLGQYTLAGRNSTSAPWGNPIPVSMGTRAIQGKIIWAANLITNPVTDPTTPGAQYIGNFAVSLGYSGLDPADRALTTISRIWVNKVLVYNIAVQQSTPGSTTTVSIGTAAGAATANSLLKSNYPNFGVALHPGLIDAQPDATIQIYMGNLTPAFRNQIYVVFSNFPLWLVGLTTIPTDVTIELVDLPGGTPSITDYSMTQPGGDDFVGLPAPLMRDTSSGLIYAFVSSGGGIDQQSISSADPTNQDEISVIPVQGASDVIDPSSCCIFFANSVSLGYPAALVLEGNGNTCPLALIDMSSGFVKGEFGTPSTSLVDTPNGFVHTDSGDCGYTVWMSLGTVTFLCGGIWDQLGCLTASARQGEGILPLVYRFSTSLGGNIGINGPDNIQDICYYPMVERMFFYGGSLPPQPIETPGLAG